MSPAVPASDAVAAVPPPVDRRVTIGLPPEAAFELFTRGMRTWWPFAGHSCADEEAEDVHFEPRIGGAVTELAKDGRRYTWGTLEAWDPPRGFAMRWHPGLPAEVATRLAVSFTAVVGGTEVRVLHDGWAARGADAAAKHDQYDHGWPVTLAALARRAAELAAARGSGRATVAGWLAGAALLAGALLGVPPPASAAERMIEKEVVIAAPLEQAWDAWTTREGIVAFFAPDAVVEPRPGGLFSIHFDPKAPEGQRGADGMRYLALQPKRMLSFEWNAPPHLPEVRPQRTVVVVRFVPVDEKTTRVVLAHTAWGDGGQWDQSYAYFDRAWGAVLGNLKKRYETGPVDWAPFLQQLDKMRAGAPKA